MFTAALFTLAKTWKAPESPLTEEWVKKMWHMYTDGILLSHEKEWNRGICRNVGGPGEYDSKWSKSAEHKYHMISFMFGI